MGSGGRGDFSKFSEGTTPAVSPPPAPGLSSVPSGRGSPNGDCNAGQKQQKHGTDFLKNHLVLWSAIGSQKCLQQEDEYSSIKNGRETLYADDSPDS